ncbi:hypothetical protein [Nitratireductor sp. GZWM139]|uniref:hypothetical protein n=1 Tax=Nitratireductor sp. GZWM139 TaxID=2950541 RepID=UPI0032DF1E58
MNQHGQYVGQNGEEGKIEDNRACKAAPGLNGVGDGQTELKNEREQTYGQACDVQ